MLLLLALPVDIAAIFQVPFLSATARLGLMGLAIGVVLVVPTVGMGMTFPLLTDIVAAADAVITSYSIHYTKLYDITFLMVCILA